MPVNDVARMLLASLTAHVEQRQMEFKLTDEVKDHILKVAEWLAGTNERCGLLLMGSPGNGKTTMMRSVGALINLILNQQEPYRHREHEITFVSARRIAELCGSADIRKEYKKLYHVPYLAIDDLGEEPTEVIDFGMVYTPLVDLLLHRYERQLVTMVTTNLTGKDIGEKYGIRILDRFREMMKIIPFKNVSFRNNNNNQ